MLRVQHEVKKNHWTFTKSIGECHFAEALNRKLHFLWSNVTIHTTSHRDTHFHHYFFTHLLILIYNKTDKKRSSFVRIIIQHLMLCMAGDSMVLTLRPYYWSWWQRSGCPGRSFVKTNVCLSEWCPRRDAERRELTGLLASLLIPEAGKGTGPNKASGPDCLASHRFINVKSSPV